MRNKRILAALICAVMIVTIILYNYKSVKAFVAESIAVSAFTNIAASLAYESMKNGTESGDVETLVDDFMDWYADSSPDVFSQYNRFVNSLGSISKKENDSYTLSVPDNFVKNTAVKFREFLDSKGTYDSTSGKYTYKNSDNSGSGNAGAFYDWMYTTLNDYYSFSDTAGNQFKNSFNSWKSNFSKSNTYIFNFYTRSSAAAQSVIVSLQNFEIDEELSKNLTNTWILGKDGTISSYNVVFNYKVTESLGSYTTSFSDSSDKVYTVDPLRQNIFTDLDGRIKALEDAKTAPVTTHYPDGTTSTAAETNVNVYVKQAVDEVGNPVTDEEGNPVYVPLSVQELVDAGIDITPDNILEKPSELVRTFPLTADDADAGVKAGAVTGAVSITNVDAIAAAITGTGDINMENMKVERNLTTVFPFSIPFDFARLVYKFRSNESVCPVITFDFSQYYPFNQISVEYHDDLVFKLDFKDYDILVKIEKFFVLMGYIFLLVNKTRDYIKG